MWNIYAAICIHAAFSPNSLRMVKYVYEKPGLSRVKSCLAMWLAKTQVSGSGSGDVARVRKAQRQLRRSASTIKREGLSNVEAVKN